MRRRDFIRALATGCAAAVAGTLATAPAQMTGPIIIESTPRSRACPWFNQYEKAKQSFSTRGLEQMRELHARIGSLHG